MADPSGALESAPSLAWATAVEAWRRHVTRVDAWALRLVGLALLPVAALVTSGWLYIDDLRAQVYASGRPLWPFVVESNNTHLAPSARTVDWLQARYAPLEHWPAVVYTLVLHLALGLAIWWLLRELVGPRPVALPFLALALLTPGTIASTAWFRQALTTQSGLVLSLVAVAATLTAVRSRRWLWTVPVVTLSVAVGLGFSERCLAALPLGLVLAAMRERLAGRRVPWGRLVVLLAPTGLVAGGFLLLYRSNEYDHGGAARADWLNLPRLIWHSLSRGILPSLLGGPWRWTTVPPSYGLARPPPALVALGVTVGALLLALGLLSRGRRRATLWAVAAFACYAVPVWAMLFLGRFAVGGLGGADDLRLWPDITVVAVVLLAAVVGSPRPAPSRGAARRAERSTRTSLRRRHGAPVRSAAVLAVAALVVSAAWSWLSFGRLWARNGARPYVTTLQSSLATTKGTVVPSSVPDTVIPAWVQADFSTTDLVGLLDPRRTTGVIDGAALAVAASGALRPASFTTWGKATPTTAGFCGFARPRESTSWLDVPFDQPVPYYRSSMLRLSLLVDDSTALRVRLHDREGGTVDLGVVSPRLTRGPHVLVVSLPYRTALTRLEVRPTEPVGLCVPGATVVTASTR